MTIEEAMEDLRATAGAIASRAPTPSAQRLSAVEVEVEYLRRDNMQLWHVLLALMPAESVS